MQAGGDFAELATKESDDTGSAANGGDLPPFHHGQMVPVFEQAAFAMEPGKISEPVKSQFGYHIIKLESKSTKSFEEAKPEIVKKLKPRAGSEGHGRSAEENHRRHGSGVLRHGQAVSVKTRKLELNCPVCGSGSVFYSCTPNCCFNHVCGDCGTTFEPVTKAMGGRLQRRGAARLPCPKRPIPPRPAPGATRLRFISLKTIVLFAPIAASCWSWN